MQEIFLFLEHHLALVIALIVILILLAIFEYIKSKKSAAYLSPAVATQMINHQNAVVLDIRSREAYTAGHIVNAISIPMAELETHYKKLGPSKAQPIIILCSTGQESARAAELLTRNGFSTFILTGGIRGWKEAEMPLVKG
ncbi:MAG: glpE 2 [Gammaproteobacteria bacterium]|nr:glpE 2 [Gammaproteobacteria bacterium]